MTHEVCYALQHATRLKDEGREGDSAQVGTGPELRDDVPEHVALIGLDHRNIFFARVSSAVFKGPSAAGV